MPKSICANSRPAARGFLMGRYITLLLLICCIASSVSAEIIIDEEISEYEDTGGTRTLVSEAGSFATSTLSRLYFYNIANHPDTKYIIVTFSGNKAAEGRYPITYTLNGRTHDAVKYVTHYKDIFGTVTSTRFEIFFDDWDIGTLTGTQYVTFSEGLFNIATHDTVTASAGNLVWLSPATNRRFTGTYTITVVSIKEWRNHLTVSDYPLNSYEIELQRVYGGKSYASTLAVLKDGTTKFSNGDTDDLRMVYLQSEIDEITVNSGVKTYSWPLDSGTDTPTLSTFTLALSPNSTTVNTPVTATLAPLADAPRYSEITYGITDPSGNVEFETFALNSSDWTTWQHYNKTSWTNEASTETAAHNPTFTPTSAGTWTVSATVRDRQPPGTGEALGSVSASCEISRAAGNVDVAISIYDGASSSTPLLYGVGVLVEDLTTNGTVLLDTREYRLDGWTGTTNGRVTVQAPLGHQIHVTAQKQGYVTRAQTEYVQPTAVPLNQMPVSIILSPATTPGPEQVYLTVLVTDLRSQPIQGASVIAAGKAGSTGAQGTCRLSVPQNQTISWTVRADGYHGASGIATPLDANSQMTVQLQPTTIPTTPGETPGGPGATPTTSPADPGRLITDGDRRSIENQIIDLIYVLSLPIALLALIGTLVNLMGGGGTGRGRSRRRR